MCSSDLSSVSGGAIHIGARALDLGLRVEVSDDAPPVTPGADDVLHDIRERLHALYGERGSLGRESSPAGGIRIVMEIPYEPTHGDHR